MTTTTMMMTTMMMMTMMMIMMMMMTMMMISLLISCFHFLKKNETRGQLTSQQELRQCTITKLCCDARHVHGERIVHKACIEKGENDLCGVHQKKGTVNRTKKKTPKKNKENK